MSDSGEQSALRLSAFPAGELVGGQYRIERLLGEGGMGAVYLAHDETLDRPVALKALRSWVLTNEGETDDHLERFRQEARLVARIHHPAVVAIYQFGEHKGFLWFAMEYVPNAVSLKDRLAEVKKGGYLELDEVRAYSSAVAAGLRATHDAGAVHRDIKPANILCIRTAEGPSAKVLDFGVAHIATSELTQNGQLVGTPEFLAPEQILANQEKLKSNPDPRSDQFSLGVTLFRALTNAKPFEAANQYGLYTQILTHRPPLPSTLRPGLPPAMDTICMTLMAKRPENRFAHMSEVQQALEHLETVGPYEPPANDDVVSGKPLQDTAPAGLPMTPGQVLNDIPEISAQTWGSQFDNALEEASTPTDGSLDGAAKGSAGRVPDEKTVRSLTSRVRFGLGAALLLALLSLGAFAYHRTQRAGGALLDKSAPDELHQITTAQELPRNKQETRQPPLPETHPPQGSASASAAAEDDASPHPLPQPDAKGKMRPTPRKKPKRARPAAKAKQANGTLPASKTKPTWLRKDPSKIASFGPVEGAERPKKLGIPTGAMVEATLLAPLSSAAPGTLVTATLPRGLRFADIGQVLPKGTTAIGRAAYRIVGGHARVEVAFDRLVFPDRTERTVSAIAVNLDGQAGLEARVTGGRFAHNDEGKEQSASKVGDGSVVATVPKGHQFKVQFTKPL